jgi:hypothetical protein
LLDIFDSSYSGLLEWPQLQLLVAALVALASGETRRFLQLHGEAMFRCLARAPVRTKTSVASTTALTISFREFVQLATVFGVAEGDLVRAILVEFKTEETRLRDQMLTQEDFFVYYHGVLRNLDEHGSVIHTPEQLLKESPLCACTIQ